MSASNPGTPHPTVDQLASLPLLSSLSQEQLAELANLTELDEFPAGRTIVREGGDGYSFYILLSGKAEVRQGSTLLRTLGAGDYFGEIGMIENTRRTASVVAVEPCVAVFLFGTTFRVLQSTHPAIAQVLRETAEERHS